MLQVQCSTLAIVCDYDLLKTINFVVNLIIELIDVAETMSDVSCMFVSYLLTYWSLRNVCRFPHLRLKFGASA